MTAPANFQPLGNRNHDSIIESTRGPILLYFHNPETKLCDLINPIVEKISENNAPGLEKCSIDTSVNKNLIYDFNVMRSPAFVIFYQEEEVRRWNRIEYTDTFDEDFQEFLVGDFLFPTQDFKVLTDRNYISTLEEWYHLNLVGLMIPADPINWQLESIMRYLSREYSNHLRANIYNAREDDTVLKQFDVEHKPALLMMEETSMITKWEPASDPDQIKEESETILKRKNS